MNWHVHFPHSSERHGVNVYYTCRCGARRVRKLGPGYSAVPADWPRAGTGWTAGGRS